MNFWSYTYVIKKATKEDVEFAQGKSVKEIEQAGLVVNLCQYPEFIESVKDYLTPIKAKVEFMNYSRMKKEHNIPEHTSIMSVYENDKGLSVTFLDRENNRYDVLLTKGHEKDYEDIEERTVYLLSEFVQLDSWDSNFDLSEKLHSIYKEETGKNILDQGLYILSDDMKEAIKNNYSAEYPNKAVHYPINTEDVCVCYKEWF